MTREEARHWLEIELKTWEDECKSKHPIQEALGIAIEALEQEPRKGHWIEHPHEWGDNWQNPRYECSCCHDWAFFDTDYCPNCGAEMSVG